jgi:hypothetical protein
MNISSDDLKKIIPGFSMGIVRAIVSHPFEMMKLKSQINQHTNFYKNLFKGVHYSVITNSLERGIQFGLYEKFKLNDDNLTSSLKSSLISTSISFPYNILLLRNVIMNSSLNIPRSIFYKSSFLEYNRNLLGSSLFLSFYNFLKEKEYPIYYRAPVSSCFVWLITYPLDSYKNILISQEKIKISFKRIYKGIQYPLLRSIPSSIIGFYVYEYMLKIYS